jgi:hypothetical protein
MRTSSMRTSWVIVTAVALIAAPQAFGSTASVEISCSNTSRPPARSMGATSANKGKS